jgi:hypothetical protein
LSVYFRARGSPASGSFQEAVLSSTIHVLYNAQGLAWDHLTQACQLVEDFQLAIESSRGQPLHVPVVTMNEANSYKLTRDEPGVSPSPCPPNHSKPSKWAKHIFGFIALHRLLTMMRSVKASDARDKVYGLLSISSGFDRVELRSDYSVSYQECYIKINF